MRKLKVDLFIFFDYRHGSRYHAGIILLAATAPRYPSAQQHTQHAAAGGKPRQSCLLQSGFVSWSHEVRRQAQSGGAMRRSSVVESHERGRRRWCVLGGILSFGGRLR